ncbi:MAG: hypothetical protein JKY15_07180 [Deltaproteobacteria bacterium]|nr:hypothetical protein [Deltaproteobacteria bacterium]
MKNCIMHAQIKDQHSQEMQEQSPIEAMEKLGLESIKFKNLKMTKS